MRDGLIISGALHIGAILFAVLGPPTLNSAPPAPPQPSDSDPIIVDLAFLEVTDVTDIKAAASDETPEAPSVDAPQEAEPEAKPTPLRIATRPSLKPKPKKPTPDDKSRIASAQAEAVPDLSTSQTAQTSAKSREGEDSKKPRASEESLKDLDDIAALVGVDEKPVSTRRAPSQAEPAERNRRGAGLGNRMSVSVRNALKAKLRGCWTPVAGAPQPEKYVVEITFRLSRDGRITDGPRVIGAAVINARTDPYWSQAALRAKRAVLRCAPYSELPADAYETEWNEVFLTFDPSEMLAPKPRGDKG